MIAICGPLALGILESCCGDLSSQRYFIDDYTMVPVAGSYDLTSGQTIFSYDVADAYNSESIDYRSLGLRIDPSATYLSYVQSTSVLSGAFACTPEEPSATQLISALEITSDQDYTTSDSTYAAGTLLNDVFYLDGDGSTNITELMSTARAAGNLTMIFALRVPPMNSSTHTFRIVIRLSDGKEFTLEAPSLTLTI